MALLAAFGNPTTPDHPLSAKALLLILGFLIAAHHLTLDSSSLIDVKEVLPCPVGLPDGQQRKGLRQLVRGVCF